jgi:uncharacterized membrane protein
MQETGRKRIVLVAIVLLAIVGLADAVYLAVKALSGEAVTCNVVEGCSVVLNSAWSQLVGVPTAVYGIGYYSVLVFFSGAYAWWRDHIVLQSLAVVATLGFIASGWFVYLQLSVIGAICEYCILSAVLTTAIFFLVWYYIYVIGWQNQQVDNQ